MSAKAKTKCFGLVGGVGPGAAAHYYMRLSHIAREKNTALDLVMVNADIDAVQVYLAANDPKGMAEYFAGLLHRAKNAEAVVGAVPSVTCHYCIGELDTAAPVPMVSLLDAVRAEVLQRGLKRAVLFGTRYAMGSKLFGTVPEVEWIAPRADEFEEVHALYESVAFSGKSTPEHHERFTKIAWRLCAEEGAECILFAGTDLALVFNESNTEFPHLDCAEAHIQAIAREIFPAR